VLSKYARHRNRAVWAQALVLFNVVGIPLSQGVYLEYYYTTALPTYNLSAVSVIPALHILCLMNMPTLVGWLYHWRGQRWGWRIAFFVTMIIAFCVQLPLQWVKSYVLIMVLQGPLFGAALGTLFALSTLVLSSHYQFNLPLVSMQSGSMGFLGAITYSMVAKVGLAKRNYFAPAATAGILLGTLFTAYLLIQRVKEDDLPPSTRLLQSEMTFPKSTSKIIKEPGTIFFIFGYILIFSGIFTHPLYIAITFTQPPALATDSYSLIILLSTATLSACISANPRFRTHLGPTDTFIASSIFSGSASILPTFMPEPYITLTCSAAYGMGLGAILSLHIKVTTIFHAEKVVWHSDMPARAAIMMALGGASAFVGLLVAAIVMESVEGGVKVVTGMTAGGLGLGGCLTGFARWRRCKKFFVAI
jgi:hypothetical protein